MATTRPARFAPAGATGRVPADGRSGRVVFLSHCLLNQNTRYFGGAVCPGVVAAAIEQYGDDGTGIVQLPCPEERVWGGVVKRRLLYVIDHPRVARAAPALVRIIKRYVRRRYARLARAAAKAVADYLSAGFTVTAIVGVAGSPSCGVHTTLDLNTALAAIAARRDGPLTAAWMNEVVVGPALRPGRGLFMQTLTDELARRRLDVPVIEHTLCRRPARTVDAGGTVRAASSEPTGPSEAAARQGICISSRDNGE